MRKIFARIWQLIKQRKRAIACFALIALVGAFLLYHCLGLGEAVYAETTPAVLSAEYELTQLQGCIFRNEEVIYSNNGGAAVYAVPNGARVGVDTTVAKVYTVGSTSEYLAERKELDSKIALLEQSIAIGSPNAYGLGASRKLKNETYAALMTALASGKLDRAAALEENMLTALLAEQRVGGSDEADIALNRLYSQRDALENSFSGGYETLITERSCYFFYGSDGYEDIFDISRLSTVDAEGLGRLMASAPAASERGQAIGKYVYDYEWYFVCPVDSELAAKLEEGEKYTLTMEDGRELDMLLDRLTAGDGGGVAVFLSSVMPEGFEYKRIQRATLTVGVTEGYRIPLEALTSREGLDGVYILSSSEIFFRRVTVLDTADGYAVVAPRDMSTENYSEFLALNDQIIISLSDGNVYEGRLLY